MSENELKEYLRSLGASLVGFADLSDIDPSSHNNMSYGIAFAVSCVKYIEMQGCDAIAQTTTYVTEDDNLTTALPHKTVATRAGLGWIGKNALLVTPEYGSAIRISSVLTDMPLKTDLPINMSRCGKCTKCTEACPASAIKGTLWSVNSVRDELLNPFACRKKARELLKREIGIEKTLCGKCIEICPVTRQYLEKSKKL